ncbi:ketoacyl-ACP synthase III [Priestia filamentosa]|uniref:Beta-ketoacyl-[acyl-carrier-protein] synthase III n=2 Tax=Priestia filamentosa TaxID=1402861 RepID=A0A1X7ED26_9BACI|nr:ketoacyl-ACP synthase III [Priestia filamentosa]AKO92802.1 3-oxoacyl-ACP synthase [Priestia filamentosa]MDT3762836.1 ketoacyl-ACP synthase III [Priestia filamentosa]OXS69371.1 ketoacyl-ACP synthase III [Priestia filamentosa]WCM13933.1 ketoacyl-ACP synthase III [Priestia filamentosa]WRU97288.1 ketoacyl-ACP synthase III [Priestia filamentosa]
MKSTAKITAIGHYLPQRVLSNEDLEKMMDTSDEWIVQRTGMKERHIAGEEEFSSDLAIKAIENLMDQYDKTVEDVDLIIVATTTADYAFPSVACRIQHYFDIKETGAFDLNATCAGFTYGLHLANSLITSGLHKKILVVASETLSKVTNYEDRSTAVLFGDGAAAFLVEYNEENLSFISVHMGTRGEGGIHLYRKALADKIDGASLDPSGKMVQNGREVYKWATRTVPKGMETLLEKGEMTKQDLDWFIPHSANLRMIESICEKVDFPVEKTLTSVETCGNTSSVSIPLAIGLGVQEGKVKKGDHMLLYGFGGGLTHLGLLIQWGI